MKKQKKVHFVINKTKDTFFTRFKNSIKLMAEYIYIDLIIHYKH